MSVKTLIFSTRLRGYRPVIWYGDTVYKRYAQLRTVLQDNLGDAYAALLTEPLVPDFDKIDITEAKWFSEYITQGSPLTTLPAATQAAVLQNLDARFAEVRQLAATLQKATDATTRQLGELLLKALDVPSLDCIYVEGEKIALVLWGFDSDEARHNNFQLSRYIEAQKPAPVTPPISTPSVPPVSTTEKPPISTPSIPPPVVPPPPPPTSEDPAPTPRRRRWWFWLLLLLLLLGLLALLYWFFGRTPDYLPSEPHRLPPIDSTKIRPLPDDSLAVPVIINRWNILLKKDASLEKFAKAFKDKYPSDSVKFIFYDLNYKLLQLEFPENKRDEWRTKLYAFPEVSVVFDDRILGNQRTPSESDFGVPEKKWYFDAINAFTAWNVTQGSDAVTIAVVDDGFDLTQPELKGRITGKPYNIADNSTTLRPVFQAEHHGTSPHGTHVASTAVGEADNGFGVSGIAPKCRLLPVQVGDSRGQMSTMSIIMGIQYAVLNGASVINLSLGQGIRADVIERLSALSTTDQQRLLDGITRTPRYQETNRVFKEIFAEATRNNVVIVKAAGNDGIFQEFDPMAATGYTLNVVAIAPNRRRAPFSSFGTNTISAPGVHIYNATPNGQFAYLDGTSMASPIVAGAVGLLKSKNPNITFAQVKELLTRTGLPIIMMDGRPIGPLIQLDKALDATATSPTDKDPCRETIDSLEREISRLKGEHGEAPPKDPMVIPCNPKDLSFAVGRWRASNDLKNRGGERIKLYFDIKADGTGNLQLIEPSGNTCTARITVKIVGGKIVLNQLENAACSPKTEVNYRQYIFKFTSNCNEEAAGEAQAKIGGDKVISFKLYKE